MGSGGEGHARGTNLIIFSFLFLYLLYKGDSYPAQRVAEGGGFHVVVYGGAEIGSPCPALVLAACFLGMEGGS